jgi:hypothetical protein
MLLPQQELSLQTVVCFLWLEVVHGCAENVCKYFIFLILQRKASKHISLQRTASQIWWLLFEQYTVHQIATRKCDLVKGTALRM